MFRVDLPLLCVALLLAAAAAGDGGQCIQQNACVCHSHDEETSLDITKLLPHDGKFITAEHGNTVFYYHGCTGAKLTPPQGIVDNQCGNGDSVLCMQDGPPINTSKILLLGKLDEAKFVVDNDNTKQTVISYSHKSTDGSVIISTVTLVCTPDFKNATLQVDIAAKNIYKLHVFSPHACKFHDPHGMSTGSQLLVIFLIFALVYLVGGGCLLYFLRGARGKEVIPHVDFWMGLPGLVKDGVIFILNGCNSRMVSTSETYDQI